MPLEGRPAGGPRWDGSAKMAAGLVALSWAQRLSPADFAAAAQAAVGAAKPAAQADARRALVQQIVEAALVGAEPSSLLVEYLQHGMMLDVLPINLTLQQLLGSPLLALEPAAGAELPAAERPVRLLAMLPVLRAFGPHITPEDEGAAELLLQLLIRLAEIEEAGAAGATSPAVVLQAVLDGKASLPMLAVARHAHPSLWEQLLQRVRALPAPSPLAPLLSAALVRLGLRLEDGSTLAPLTEHLALHDGDIARIKSAAAQEEEDDELEREDRPRVRPRLGGWDASSLPRRRQDVASAAHGGLVMALSAGGVDGRCGSAKLGAAVCIAVRSVVKCTADALTAERPVPWHQSRALAQLLVGTVASAVDPTAVSAAVAAAAVNQAGGFSPEKDAVGGGSHSDEESSAETLSQEHMGVLSAACGEVLVAVAAVLRAPSECAPTLPLALEVLTVVKTALAAGESSGDAGATALREALLGGAETPRVALARGWARHGGADAGLALFDLKSEAGREEMLQLARGQS